MIRRSLVALAAVVLVASAHPAWAGEPRSISERMAAFAADTLRDPNARQHLAFTPAPLERCDYFFVTETGLSQINRPVDDWLDNHIIRNSFGLMKNISANQAVGASLDAHWLEGVVTVSPSVRFRQWMGRRQSVELSVGYVANHLHGLDGPVAGVRYSPHPALFVEGGICRVKADWYRYGYNGGVLQYGHVEDHTWQAYGGVGLAAGPGMGVWVAELLALGFVGVVLLGMD